MTDRERLEDIKRRLGDQTRDELAFHQRFLDETRGSDSLASQLVRAQVESEVDRLEQTLTEIEEVRLDLVLSGEEASAHRVPAELLGRIVSRLQRGVSRIGWALEAGADEEKEPPAKIRRLTAFDVVALSPSSFRVSLRGRTIGADLMAEQMQIDAPHLLEMSMDALMSLLDAAERRDLDESMEDLAHDIGRVSARNVHLLMQDLSSSAMTARFDWAASTGSSHATISPATAKHLSDWLRSVEDRTSQRIVRGTLHGGDDLVGRFKIVDANENIIEGSADPDVLAGKIFGNRYEATIEVTERIAENIGSRTERYRLLRLRDVDAEE